ncbi:MAG: phosphotransferase [Desulfobacterales bacterium]|nr:phosphotransferase [Desulfobacterales bacterium]
MIHTAANIVAKHYALGELIDAKEIHGGYCNRSFGFVFEKSDQRIKYLVRRYNQKAAEKEIKFEHALVRHLKKNGFDKVAGVIPNKTGGSYVYETPSGKSPMDKAFWAVFEFLEGEDRYTWIDTHIALEDMISAAKVLAQLHIAGQDFHKPPDADRVQLKIMDFLPTFRQVYAEFTHRAGSRKFDQTFLNHREAILKTIDRNLVQEPDLFKLHQLPIHCDYHQGNLKYQGANVIGVFDLDWSKVDLRLFDLALALVYFCAVWNGQLAGSLDLAKLKLFFKTYNNGCKETADPVPLTTLEKKYLPCLLASANLYVLHWTIVDFYCLENPDDAEYMKYLRHGLNLMGWIESQKDHIAKISYEN